MENRKVVAVIENHFDQIWKRRFKADFVYRGQNVISYEKIEQYYIDKNIELAALIPDYKFQIENICVVENYIERFPEKKEIIKGLYKNGVLKTMNTGYTILDSNFISPEAIIRNYLISDALFKEYVGETPRIANRSDAFGNSAQMPQILRNFGAEHVIQIYYNKVGDDEVWQGLDKSAVCVKDHAFLGGGGSWNKQRICPSCDGFGVKDGKTCPDCNGMGIDLNYYEECWQHVSLNPNETASGVMRVGGEEVPPHPETPERIKRIREETGVDISIGHWDYLLELYSKEINKVNKGDFSGLNVHDSTEYNPNTTGGYISRIKTKQRLQESENYILSGETVEAMRYLDRKDPFSYGKEWRRFLLCGFHDAAYGTIVDQAYDEIMEMYDDINKTAAEKFLSSDEGDEVLLFNPTSTEFSGIYRSKDGRLARVEGLAPYSSKKFSYLAPPAVSDVRPTAAKGPEAVILTDTVDDTSVKDNGNAYSIENEYFLVEADDRGIFRITDKKLGVLSDVKDGIRPFEWILQSDIGSPWATLEPPYLTQKLEDKTRFLRQEKGEGYIKVCYRTELFILDVNVASRVGEILWSLTLLDGYNRIMLDAIVNWATAGKRLMLALPVAFNGKDIYGIPGGRLEREPYEPRYTWNGANGDWPAFRWGGIESEDKSLAVINRGTPAYTVKHKESGKIMYISVLRSPVLPVCLHGPEGNVMVEYDGMRDEGLHSFSFELASYESNFANSSIERDAEHFYRPLLPVCDNIPYAELPVSLTFGATVTHIKPAEDKNGLILRLTEQQGTEKQVELTLPSWVGEVYRTEMAEKTAEKLDISQGLKLKLRAFEIATLRLCK